MKRTAPPTIFAGGFGNNRMIASAVNDLPQPDSPTMARVSPAETVSDRPSTAGNTPRRVNNDTCRSSIERIGVGTALLPMIISAIPQLGVKRIVEAIAHKVEREHSEHDRETRHRTDVPGRANERPAVPDQLSPTGDIGIS
jgi:hypothetical protein